MDETMRDLSRCNDIVNAVSNSCKRLVRCADGCVVVATHEPTDMNSDVTKCLHATREISPTEDETVPRVFTENFKKDLMTGVFDKCIPWVAKANERSETAMCRAVLPGLSTIRYRLRQMAAENNDDTLTSGDISSFFDDHKCTNELCVRDAFGTSLPPLNVSHPEWFYFPDDRGYLDKASCYIKHFLAAPCSSRCYLCDTFFRLTEEQDSVDLYGLPEQFRLNDIICSLYGRYEVKGELCGMKITSGGTYFVTTWKNRVYY
jgi:hypothetical protein